jgi:threonylcarbamoyladenosine tRNA methylthiotransferase MtaB
MPQVPGPVIKERAAELRAKGNAVLASYLAKQNGRIIDVLIEGDGKGRTPQFAEVDVRDRADARMTAGRIVRTRITGATPARLIGEVCA